MTGSRQIIRLDVTIMAIIRVNRTNPNAAKPIPVLTKRRRLSYFKYERSSFSGNNSKGKTMPKKDFKKDKQLKRMSRRYFLGGMAAGAFGALGLSGLKRMFEFDPDKPQLLYEFSVDNFWFTKVDNDLMLLNPPLKGNHKADIVIIGGGFTGLSAAYHLIQAFPDKKIVILEGAFCGYGASGRNGGHHGPDIGGLRDHIDRVGPERGKNAFDVTVYGEKMIREFVYKHGVDCEFHENGTVLTAITEDQMALLEAEQAALKAIGIQSELIQGKSLAAEVNSPRFIGGLSTPYGGRVNPAMLVRGMKRVVEQMGGDIREQTLVLNVETGRNHRIETELGTITAPILVLGLNAYAHTLGFFKSGTFPLGAYNLATEPLTGKQLGEIGWHNGKGLHDMRLEFDYLLLSADNRIVIGGSEYPYYANDGLSSGNNKRVLEKLEQSLFKTFPQLEGTKIDHKWGGSVSCTLDGTPSVGVMGDHGNIFYGVGYNGHGISFAHTAAKIITDLIVGEKNVFTDFFLVNHAMPYLGPRPFRYLGFHLYKRFL